ncbi:MAG: DUF2059 domain-containing protein [Pseudohongiellaceae bacterium]
MATESKKDKATRLFELTNTGQWPPASPDASQKMQDVRKAISDVYRELKIELFEKHYTEEQLDALLGFYESDIGSTVLEAQANIEHDFKKKMSKTLNDMNSKGDGGLNVVYQPKD